MIFLCFHRAKFERKRKKKTPFNSPTFFQVLSRNSTVYVHTYLQDLVDNLHPILRLLHLCALKAHLLRRQEPLHRDHQHQEQNPRQGGRPEKPHQESDRDDKEEGGAPRHVDAQGHVRQMLRVVGEESDQLARAGALPRLVGEAQGLAVGDAVEHRARVHAEHVEGEEVVVEQQPVAAEARDEPVKKVLDGPSREPKPTDVDRSSDRSVE